LAKGADVSSLPPREESPSLDVASSALADVLLDELVASLVGAGWVDVVEVTEGLGVAADDEEMAELVAGVMLVVDGPAVDALLVDVASDAWGLRLSELGAPLHARVRLARLPTAPRCQLRPLNSRATSAR
jgi:hypothetical protein